MSEDERSIKSIYTELVSHPFFPLLFIAETIKTASVVLVGADPLIAYLLLSVVATAMWVLSDSIDVEVDTDSIIGDE